MRTFIVAIVGLLVQALGLALFITVATTPWAETGKPIVIGGTILAMAILLVFANNPYRFFQSVGYSALLAFGYLVAYHVIGISFSPALLAGLQMPSVEYAQAVAPIFGLLFGLYLLGSAVAGMFNKAIHAWRGGTRFRSL